jgi:hypothetical protein
MTDIVPQVSSTEQMPHYRLPRWARGGLLWDLLAQRPRSFARDAQAAVAGLRTPPMVLGTEQLPSEGPCLVTCNHYTRPGFAAWWLTLAITAAVAAGRAPGADPEIHWVMTAGWRFQGSRWKPRILTPVTRWACARVARVYGFVTMPPMPPAPEEMGARAAGVLRTVRLARHLAQEGGMVGLAPEGRDVPEGLGEPPEGVGEFICLLVKAGLPILPVGVTELGGRLRISFGQLFVPEIPRSRIGRDRMIAQEVMRAIATQLQ